MTLDDGSFDLIGVDGEPDHGELTTGEQVFACYIEQRTTGPSASRVGAVWYSSSKKLLEEATVSERPSESVQLLVEMALKVIEDRVQKVVRREVEPLREDIARLLGEDRLGLPGEVGAARLDTGRMWNAREAASFMGVSLSWIYHRAAAGSIPCFRAENTLRFDPEALRAWVRGERKAGRVVALKK